VSSLKLSIDSDLGDVSLVAVAVNSICIYLGLNRIEASQVALCTVEAVTNLFTSSKEVTPFFRNTAT
jgi:hypothetical protein